MTRLPLGLIARRLKEALSRPEPQLRRPGLLATLLLKPRLFDLLSVLLQLWDVPRMLTLRDDRAPVNDGHQRQVYDYNLGVTLDKVITRTRRMEHLYAILSVIRHDLPSARLLCVGPRNVHELLIAWLYGFQWRNIFAIDLYSTNPKIQVMDMERMTFEKETFDVVVMSATLAYADDTSRCIGEVSRVLKTGGSFCFHATYSPEGSFKGNLVSGKEIAGSLGGNKFALRHYETFEKVNRQNRRLQSHVFCVDKIDPEAPQIDALGFL